MAVEEHWDRKRATWRVRKARPSTCRPAKGCAHADCRRHLAPTHVRAGRSRCRIPNSESRSGGKGSRGGTEVGEGPGSDLICLVLHWLACVVAQDCAGDDSRPSVVSPPVDVTPLSQTARAHRTGCRKAFRLRFRFPIIHPFNLVPPSPTGSLVQRCFALSGLGLNGMVVFVPRAALRRHRDSTLPWADAVAPIGPETRQCATQAAMATGQKC